MLWSKDLVPTASRIYAHAQERFFDPNQNAVIGSDTQVWQYNFLFSPTEELVQKEGTIYWLDVQVMPQPPLRRPEFLPLAKPPLESADPSRFVPGR